MNFKHDHASARRHLGVALIDLAYAAADLRRCGYAAGGHSGEQFLTAAELLERELSQLKALSDFIDGVGSEPPPPEGAAGDVAHWWPELVRGRNLSARSD